MLELRMIECNIAFSTREDGGKVMHIIDPMSTIKVDVPLPAEACTMLSEWVGLPNEELDERLEQARIAQTITIPGAENVLEQLRQAGQDGR